MENKKNKDLDTLLEVYEKDFDRALFEKLKQYNTEIERLIEIYNHKDWLQSHDHVVNYYYDLNTKQYLYISDGKEVYL